MIKVIMHGCNGRMGQTITGLLSNDTEARIVAGVDMVDCRDNGYPVFTNLADCNVEADVVIDFASSKAVDGLLDYCVERQIPVVLCTTGLSNEQLLHVEEASKKVAVLKSGNMSLGINTIQKLVAQAAKVLAPAGFDVEIVEKHIVPALDYVGKEYETGKKFLPQLLLSAETVSKAFAVIKSKLAESGLNTE